MHTPTQKAHLGNPIVLSDGPWDLFIISFPSFPHHAALLFKWKYLNKEEEKTNKNKTPINQPQNNNNKTPTTNNSQLFKMLFY